MKYICIVLQRRNIDEFIFILFSLYFCVKNVLLLVTTVSVSVKSLKHNTIKFCKWKPSSLTFCTKYTLFQTFPLQSHKVLRERERELLKVMSTFHVFRNREKYNYFGKYYKKEEITCHGRRMAPVFILSSQRTPVSFI